MMVSAADVAIQRLRNQRLLGTDFLLPADVVRWLGAVQSQDYHGAKWAVGQRMTAATDADLDAAFDRGEILRTHMLRPTWHFVAPEDIRWMLALTGPRVHALNASMCRQLGLDAGVLTRAQTVIGDALAGGHALTRTEIGSLLGRHGTAAAGQRLAYIVMHAELDALICSGPLKGKQHTYALLDERVPPTPPRSRDEALAELAGRYFQSHGPATAHDFAWWSGLTVADAKAGIGMGEPALESGMIDDTAYWFPAWNETAAPSPTAHLLPNYDEFFSPRDKRLRGAGPAPERMKELLAAGRLDGHHIVIDGQLRGGWRRHLAAKQAPIELDPFDELTVGEQLALDIAIGEYGGFLERTVTIA